MAQVVKSVENSVQAPVPSPRRVEVPTAPLVMFL